MLPTRILTDTQEISHTTYFTMDARTQRRLKRNRVRELNFLVEEIQSAVPVIYMGQPEDFIYLWQNVLAEDIQNGNNENWFGTKYFTLLSVIKDWGKERTKYIDEVIEDFEGDNGGDEIIYCSNPVDDFRHEDIQKQIQKMDMFQKKLDELYTNKFSLSRKSGETEYDNLLNELRCLKPPGKFWRRGPSDNNVEKLLMFCNKYRLK
tara:strand:- start:140 stop:757 length:618 start_codon:yes stop_codon:yes gene_type:complete